MSRPCLLLAHGWGCDATIWDGLRAALGEADTLVVEHGYFGARPHRPCPAPGAIAVGHSAGLLDLLADLPPRCAGVVAINGFTRFAHAADFPHGTPARVLDRMTRRLSEDPDSTVRAFRDRAGLPPASRPARHDRLRAGLDVLAAQDRRAALQGMRLLALASAGDPVATPAITRACFGAADIAWHPGDSHVLPLAEPAWCAEHLRRFAA